MSGDESEHSLLARNFKTMIEEKLPTIKVVLIDERWTTKQANRRLLEADLSRKKRKNVIDKMSAVVILETNLQMRGKEMKLENNQIVFEDEQGRKTYFNIYFSYKDDQTNKNYIFFYTEDNPEEIIVAQYLEDEQQFIDVEDDDELDKLEKILQEYQEEQDN
ncbi:putative Holliday junction resolvase [Firmicutes bacterium CAG:449]|nr:putative Holliday junction resolvase [Firmicutes bacterium CAG:449]